MGQLNDEGKEIKGSACSPFPPQTLDHGGQFDMEWVTQDRPIALAIARIADQLWIPETDAWLSRCLWREDGDSRANLSAICRETEVFDEGCEDILGRLEVTHIAHYQGSPVEPSNAACVVPPGHFCSIGQFVVGVPIGTGLCKLGLHLAPAMAATLDEWLGTQARAKRGGEAA